MLVQVAVLDETSRAVNIIVVESEEVTPEFLDPLIEAVGASSWLDLRKMPYPWDWDKTECNWNSTEGVWEYPEGFSNEPTDPSEE